MSPGWLPPWRYTTALVLFAWAGQSSLLAFLSLRLFGIFAVPTLVATIWTGLCLGTGFKFLEWAHEEHQDPRSPGADKGDTPVTVEA